MQKKKSLNWTSILSPYLSLSHHISLITSHYLSLTHITSPLSPFSLSLSLSLSQWWRCSNTLILHNKLNAKIAQQANWHAERGQWGSWWKYESCIHKNNSRWSNKIALISNLTPGVIGPSLREGQWKSDRCMILNDQVDLFTGIERTFLLQMIKSTPCCKSQSKQLYKKYFTSG